MVINVQNNMEIDPLGQVVSNIKTSLVVLKTTLIMVVVLHEDIYK